MTQGLDPPALARLHAAAMAADRPWSEAEFADLLAAPGTLLLGGPDAALLGRIVADEAEVLTLATHPERRRLGLARGLLEAFHGEAAVRGAGRAFLEVAEDNTAARALYEGAGYGPAGRRPRYYARPGGAVAALVMARPLP